MSPETLSGKLKKVHPGLDIWSMGCILFALVCGYLPFAEPTNKATAEKIVACNYVYPPKITLSREIKDLITKMLTVDHTKRITIIEVMDHPWMNNQKL
jgi:serine/threonine protein kinase